MNQEIHVILINHDQNKSYRDQQFISFVQNGLAIEDNACTRQNSCKDTPVSETAFSMSYLRMERMKVSCRTDEVVRNRHSIRNRNRIVGK